MTSSVLNEMKNDLTTKMKSLIQLEVDKIVKKKKEEFNMIVLKLQERITALELEEDDLEKYGQHVCIGTEDVPVEFNEQLIKYIKRFVFF